MKKLLFLTLALFATGCVSIPQHGVRGQYTRLMPGLELTVVNNTAADCLEITVSDGQSIECLPLGKPVRIYINRDPMGPQEVSITATGKTKEGGYLGIASLERNIRTRTTADTWVVNHLRAPRRPRIIR